LSSFIDKIFWLSAFYDEHRMTTELLSHQCSLNL